VSLVAVPYGVQLVVYTFMAMPQHDLFFSCHRGRSAHLFVPYLRGRIPLAGGGRALADAARRRLRRRASARALPSCRFAVRVTAAIITVALPRSFHCCSLRRRRVAGDHALFAAPPQRRTQRDGDAFCVFVYWRCFLPLWPYL